MSKEKMYALPEGQHDNDEENAHALPKVQHDSNKEKLYSSTDVQQGNSATFCGDLAGISKEPEDPKNLGDTIHHCPDRTPEFQHSFCNQASEPLREGQAADKGDSRGNINAVDQGFQLTFPNQASEPSRDDQAAKKGDAHGNITTAGTNESGDNGLMAVKALDKDSAVKEGMVSNGKMADIHSVETSVPADKKHDLHTHTVNGKLSDDNKKQNEDEEDDDDDHGVPIDRGWAWMIDLGCFILFLIYYIPSQVHSVLLLDYTERFDCSVSVITAMLSLGSITYCITTQVTVNILLTHLSIRTVTAWAAVLNVVASLVFVVSVNIPTFFIINTIKHLSMGSTLISTLTLVGFYFRRRRALASALGLLGSSVASIMMPPLIRYLSAEYGFRGCFLLLAGIEMHAIPAALLLRPFSSYKSKKPGVTKETSTKTEQAPLLTVTPTDTAHAPDSVDTSVIVEPRQTLMGITKQRIVDNEKEGDIFLTANQKQRLGNFRSKEQIQFSGDDLSIVSISGSESGLRYLRSGNKHHLGASISDVVGGSHDWPVLTSSFMGSAVSIATGVVSEDGTFQDTLVPSGRCHYIYWIKKIMDVSVLKNFLCLMILVNYVLGNAGCLGTMYLPSYAIEIGASPTQAAVLLTVFGATDMVGRIALGIFADLKFLRPTKIIFLTSLALGTVNHFVSFYRSFGLLVFLAVVYGLLSCASQNLNTAVIVDILGIDHLAKMWAVCSLFLNFSLVLQFPLLGVLIEATGSFVATFYYVGTSFLLCAATLFCEPCIQRLQRARERHRPN